jgi:hypothetical protein
MLPIFSIFSTPIDSTPKILIPARVCATPASANLQKIHASAPCGGEKMEQVVCASYTILREIGKISASLP